jgi:hypothetical protein
LFKRLAHGQQTKRQDHRPESGQKLADKANRAGGAERCPAPAVPQSVAGDRALLDDEGRRRRAVELPLVQTAQEPKAPSRRPSAPGIGQIVSVVLLYDLPP